MSGSYYSPRRSGPDARQCQPLPVPAAAAVPGPVPASARASGSSRLRQSRHPQLHPLRRGRLLVELALLRALLLSQPQQLRIGRGQLLLHPHQEQSGLQGSRTAWQSPDLALRKVQESDSQTSCPMGTRKKAQRPPGESGRRGSGKGPGEEDMCGRLNFSMCGTRSAATNWQAHYTNVSVQNGFIVGWANNCTFYNEEKDVYCMVHGDDFVRAGPSNRLQWFENTLTTELKINKNRSARSMLQFLHYLPTHLRMRISMGLPQLL